MLYSESQGLMNYVVFDSSDAPYLRWLQEHPNGYVLNTRGGKGSRFAMVHRAACPHISRQDIMEADAFTGRLDIKVGATSIDGLLEFLMAYKTVDQGVLEPCGSCKATTEPIPFNRRPASTTRKSWSREELLILLNLYEKIPFGKFDQGNPVLIDIAGRMERTPGSVAMKLSNLASLDARLAARGIKGLSGASALDRTVWAEFHQHQELLIPESEALLAVLLTGDADSPVEVEPEVIRVLRVPAGPTESTASVKVRRGQRFFRQAVLNAYNGRCAVTGLAVRDLLIASHIIPWNAAETHRLDPQNGIALNALHDKAFDRGLITFDPDLRLVCAPSLRNQFTNATIAHHFKAYEGHPLTIPAEAAGPKPEYLEWHREKVFGRCG